MTDAQRAAAADRARFENAYAACAQEIASFPAEALADVDLEAFDALVTVVCALPLLRMLTPLLTQIKGVQRAQVLGIERYAYATAYVDFRQRALRGEDVAELHRRALAHQERLCAAAAAAALPAELAVVDASSRALEAIGPDLCRRAVCVQELLGPQLPEAKELEGLYRSAVEAELHAELLMACLQPPTGVTDDELEAERARVFSLLIHAYEPTSEAARWLFRNRSQVDALAHSYALSQVAEVMGPEALRFFEPGGEGSRSN